MHYGRYLPMFQRNLLFSIHGEKVSSSYKMEREQVGNMLISARLHCITSQNTVIFIVIWLFPPECVLLWHPHQFSCVLLSSPSLLIPALSLISFVVYCLTWCLHPVCRPSNCHYLLSSFVCHQGNPVVIISITFHLYYYCGGVKLSLLILILQMGPLWQPRVTDERMEHWFNKNWQANIEVPVPEPLYQSQMSCGLPWDWTSASTVKS